VVIIIDDIGHQRSSGLRAANLPGKLTLAILPHTPNGPELANLAAAAGKEVILHAPMSNLHKHPLGPGGLSADMREQAFMETLQNSIRSTPHIRGVSNHMGSQLTSMRQPMEWVMQELARQQLYFVDSRTIGSTVAASVAREYGVPTLSRQVFLDNEINRPAIARKFELLLETANSRGIAVAIGHPHSQTLDYLAQVLPTLEERGFRMELVSEALAGGSIPGTTTVALKEPGVDATGLVNRFGIHSGYLPGN
jgi:polysaccharide deacetylase 2 family uncharacterized protein YibQ